MTCSKIGCDGDQNGQKFHLKNEYLKNDMTILILGIFFYIFILNFSFFFIYFQGSNKKGFFHVDVAAC